MNLSKKLEELIDKNTGKPVWLDKVIQDGYNLGVREMQEEEK